MLKLKTNILIILVILLNTGCLFQKDAEKAAGTAVAAASRYLYVASGACFAPTVQTGNRTITRYNLATGAAETFYDFNTDGSYDLPGGMVDLGDSVLVAVNPVDNAVGSTKQIISINKSSKAKTVFYQDSTYLPAGAANTVRGLARSLYDGNVYISRSAQVEKVDYVSKAKMPNYTGVFANAFLNGATTALGATQCLGVTAVATALIYDIVITANGRAIVSQAVTGHNKVAVTSNVGVNATTDCTDSEQGLPIVATATPTLGAAAVGNIPTGLVLHSISGKLLVAMSGTVATNNSIIAYSYNDTTGILSSPAIAYYGTANVYQPTAMAEDTATGNIYVASYGQLTSGAMGFIRKFTAHVTTGVLTDAGLFSQNSVYNKCVSSMFVGQ